MERSSGPDAIRLLSDVNASDGAALTFDRVLQCMAEAAESIVIHMFVWRNDEIGNRVGRAILAAADRGVKVHLIKDIGAFMYERIEMNRKSFFNIPIPATRRLMYRLSALSFPDTYVLDDNDDDLGRAVMAHENVTMAWVDHTHTKYYVFDQRILITGSINIEDRHRTYHDYMVEISGRDCIERFHRFVQQPGQSACTPRLAEAGGLSFVLNQVVGGRRLFEIKPAMLDLMSRAQRSLYIEMAYIGDPDISRKIVEVSKRGVQVTMLFSKQANIGNDINYRSLYRICRQADIAVFLSGPMIHSKLMLIDDDVAILGSANTSVFSMQKAEELDVIVRDNPAFLAALRATIDRRLGQGKRVESLAELRGYSKVTASLQQLHQLIH